MGTQHAHRVCTYSEAEKAIRAHSKIFVNDCFCRGPAKAGKTKWEYCGHPVKTCMGFHKPKPAKGQPSFKVTEISATKALSIFEKWKKQGNFFRFMAGKGWICCCCACGCGWFRDKKGKLVKDPCGKSPYIEKTERAKCDLCGKCVKVCAYGARVLKGGKLVITRKNCYGCSACEYVCPQDAIRMVRRVKGS
ncbi:MAG: 4Fe-4S binding protein [Planctomycetota bacterium]|nr:4Fe-4S binding protein [Planctomycetota bacterium]